MNIVGLGAFYAVAGAFFFAVAARIARDRLHRRRWTSALFWALVGTVFMAGGVLPPLATGYAVLAIAVLAGLRSVVPSSERGAAPHERAGSAGRLRNRIFLPALVIPGAAIAGSLLLGRIHIGDVHLVDPRNVSVISVSLGALVAIGVGLRITGARASAPAIEGGRLLQAIGWVILLPQMLAALGGIFLRAGVGAVVADLVGRALPTQFPFVAVAAYCLGMMLFTVCMGNAFAAFAVITSGIGLPFIVVRHGGNPAIMAAIGMLSGYCGTLLTPMAANFNVVPAVLLELEDRNAVIKAQLPLALVIFAANVLLMQFCVYRF